MKTFLACTGVLLGSSFLSAADAAKTDDARAADIAELTEIKVNEWRRIYAERDAEALEDFLAEEFIVLSPVGVMSTKDEEIEYLRTTPPDSAPSDFVYSISEILFQGEDVAVIFGHGDSTRSTEEGEPCHHRYWSSNTLVRENGAWKALFSHVSDSSCTPIEDRRRNH